MEPTETESASNGRMGPRSRNGCWTCRARKVKCDEHRPRCHRCTRLDLVCDYSLRYKPGTKFVSKLENQPLPASPGESNGDGNRHVGAIVSRKLRNSLKHVQNWAAVSSLNQRLPVPLPALTNSACSLELQPADHEAIRYYHSTFARINNTKNPTYSIYSIIFNKAERDPMVMLMLLALSGHEMDHRKNGGVHDDATMVGRSMPPFLQHYCRALGLMRQAIQPPDKWPTVDLEAICINMLLMLIYEEKFGQANPKTLATYLNGAATILQCYFHGLRSINQISSPRRTRHAAASAAPGDANQPSNHQLTPFLAGLLNFLCIHDVSAMSFGIGGRVCAALQDLMQHVPNGNGIDIIHRYSYSVYGAAGIHDYPYSELLNDIEIRAVSVVYSQGLILRYMVAELELLKPAPEPGVVQCRIGDMYALIHNVEVSSSEVLTAACKLSASADNTRRSVASIRALVPQYLAALLDFQRLRIRLAQPPALEEVSAEENVQLIMDLAVQAHQYEGINAMVRIAWPLFMAAVETTNAVHLEWILSRFDDMGCFGKNYQRAYRFLSRTPGVEFFVL